MERIIVVAKDTEVNHALMALLSALFPECDIRIASFHDEGLETCSNDWGSGSSLTETRG
jgi:hypothetical protein